jgi:hypothetical protein
MNTADVNIFVVLLALTQFLFFLSTSPINVAILEAVPEAYRNSAMAISIFAAHILGDAISAPLIGEISDRTGSLQNGILICTPVILLSSLFWYLGNRTQHNRPVRAA